MEHLFRDCEFTKKVLQESWQFQFGQCGIIEINTTMKGKREGYRRLWVFIKAYILELDKIKSITEVNIKPKEEFWRPPRQNKSFDGGVYLPIRKNWGSDNCRSKCVSSSHNIWQEMGFQDLIVEDDALTVIKKLKSDSKDRLAIGNIINEIKRKRPIFLNLSFQFNPRNANEVTHTLVVRGHNLTSPSYEIEEVPTEVEPTIFGEVWYGVSKEDTVIEVSQKAPIMVKDAKKRKCTLEHDRVY
ncbi:hypothetical protein Gotur_007996, partial [Gossypium turneri]